MFTVCPKCALTLVVTAADLRVAQGYVRCGRCSNVFNALARLSEDRGAPAAAAQAQTPPETPPAPKPAQQKSDWSATFRTAGIPDSSATGKTRLLAQDPSVSAKLRQPAAPRPPPPAAQLPKRYDDDSIPEEDLEFNPDATDLNKVFVEQPPSPQFTAATGTFKSLRLEAESSARAAEQPSRTGVHEMPSGGRETRAGEHETAPAGERETPAGQHETTLAGERGTPAGEQETTAREREAHAGEHHTPAGEREAPADEHETAAHQREAHAGEHETPLGHETAAGDPFDPVDTQVDVEIDPDLLAAMEQLTSNRLKRLNPTPESDLPSPVATRESAAPSGKTAPVQRPMEQPAQPRPEARRPTSLETAQALRAALLPRKRSPLEDTAQTSGEQPTSFFGISTWTAGSAVLVLVLLIQVVHHYRHDLAANATLNGPLTSIYAVLGMPIVPRWDLTAYEVRQLGASAAPDAPGQITVRASVKNGAHQPQPLPLLRVTLQDRFGNRIASRDVPPQSYLPHALARSSILSAGQRVDADMAFVDPGANAVGFEIDACLPAPGGAISCANDTAR